MPTISQRVSRAGRQGQDPKDRLWAVVYVLIVLTLLVGLVVVVYSEAIRDAIDQEQELGFQRGSVDCLSVVVDNDRNFDLPPYCRRVEVLVFYPIEVCNTFFPRNADCSSNWEGG